MREIAKMTNGVAVELFGRIITSGSIIVWMTFLLHGKNFSWFLPVFVFGIVSMAFGRIIRYTEMNEKDGN